MRLAAMTICVLSFCATTWAQVLNPLDISPPQFTAPLPVPALVGKDPVVAAVGSAVQSWPVRADSGKAQAKGTGPLHRGPAISMSGGGSKFAYGLGKDVALYETDEKGVPTEVAKIEVGDRVTAVAVSDGGKFLAAATDGGMEVFNVANRKRVFSDTTESVAAVASASGATAFSVTAKGDLKRFDVATTKPTHQADVQCKLQGSVKMQVSPDDGQLAVGTPDGKVFLFAAKSLDPLFSQDLEDSVHAVRFTPDGKRLIVACFTGEVHVFELLGPKKTKRWSFKTEEVPEHVAMSADGKRLYVGVWGGGMLACDLADNPADRVLWRWKVPRKAER